MTKTKNTKQRLIETAVDLIWKSSYGAVSVDDICKTAGVQKGSFYHYFDSKASLTFEAFKQHADEIHSHMDHIFSPSLPPLERLKKFAAFGYEYQKHTLEKYGYVCGSPFCTLASEMVGQDDNLRERVETLFSKHALYYNNLFIDLIADGHMPKDTDLKQKAIALDCFIVGQFLLARVKNDLSILKDSEQGIFNLLEIKREERAQAA